MVLLVLKTKGIYNHVDISGNTENHKKKQQSPTSLPCIALCKCNQTSTMSTLFIQQNFIERLCCASDYFPRGGHSNEQNKEVCP